MNNKAHINWEAYSEENCYLISSLFVPVEQRGQGMARKLLREALAEMKALGEFKSVKLNACSSDVDPKNPIDDADLVEFYESEGFDVVYAGEIVAMELVF